MTANNRLASGLLVAVLVAASIGALIGNQRTRADGLVLESIHLSGDIAPDGDGIDDVAAISFRIRDADIVDVDILGPDGEFIRTLVEDCETGDDEVIEEPWDGTDENGTVVPPGIYKLRIQLQNLDRTVTPEKGISVEEDED